MSPAAPARKPARAPAPGRVYRGIGTDERRAQRRAQLIDAGTQVFGEIGFNAATVRAVCAEAGLTERYFYESFENSEALLAAVYEHLTEELREQVVQALSRVPTEPSAMARAGLAAYFRYLQRHPQAARVILVEVLGVNAHIDQLYRRATADFIALLRKVTNALAPCTRHGLDDELISTGLIGAVILISTQWVLGGCRKPVSAVVDAALAIFEAVNDRLCA